MARSDGSEALSRKTEKFWRLWKKDRTILAPPEMSRAEENRRRYGSKPGMQPEAFQKSIRRMFVPKLIRRMFVPKPTQDMLGHSEPSTISADMKGKSGVGNVRIVKEDDDVEMTMPGSWNDDDEPVEKKGFSNQTVGHNGKEFWMMENEQVQLTKSEETTWWQLAMKNRIIPTPPPMTEAELRARRYEGCPRLQPEASEMPVRRVFGLPEQGNDRMSDDEECVMLPRA